MAIDRAFVLHGVGVVATGSVHAGTAQAGETVTIAPAGRAARLRGLRSTTATCRRCGPATAAPSTLPGSRSMTCGAATGSSPGRIWQRNASTCTCGSSPANGRFAIGHPPICTPVPRTLPCRIGLLGQKSIEPGETALAALHLDRPIAAWAGQKFILRDQSAQHTRGGGRVLDPLPPVRQNVVVRLARLGALNAPDATAAFAAMLAVARRGLDVAAFARAWNLTAAEASALLAAGTAVVCRDGDACIVMRRDHWRGPVRGNR